MEDLLLQDIIAAHTRALANHLEEFLPLIRLLRLLDEGPVSHEHVVTMMHWTPQQVEEILQASGFVVDATAHLARTIAEAARRHAEEVQI